MVFDHNSPYPPHAKYGSQNLNLKKCLNVFYYVRTHSKQILAPSNNNFDHQRRQCHHANISYETVHQYNSFSTYNKKNNMYLSLKTKLVNVLIPEDKYSIQNYTF